MKFVLDADGAIKLAKAGILEKLTAISTCVITKQVAAEVSKGKEKLYEDAFLIEGLIKKEKMKLIDVAVRLEQLNLGPGETSVLVAFQPSKANAIISDDRKFLAVCEERHIPFLRPSDIIVLLYKKRHLQRKEADFALLQMRPFITEEDYQEVKNLIGGV